MPECNNNTFYQQSISRRQEVAVIVAISIALLAMFSAMPNSRTSAGLWIETYQQRLAPLRNHLAHVSHVGYISDAAMHKKTEAFFQLAQYVLAPVIIEDSPDLDMVIGNFIAEESCDKLCKEHNLEIHLRFPDEVYLLRKKR